MPPRSTHIFDNGVVKKLAKRPALPSYVGSFDSVRLRLSTLRMTVEGKVTHSQNDIVWAGIGLERTSDSRKGLNWHGKNKRQDREAKEQA